MSPQDSESTFGADKIQRPVSKIYEFEELISEGPITQSWVAINLKTGKRCFVKAVIASAAMDESAIRSMALKSYDLQKLTRSDRLLRAGARISENGRLFIEYPYLNRNDWKPLNFEFLKQHFVEVLTQICLTVDYLHLLGLVHGDLKLENFLIHQSGDRVRLKMIDFDFLTTTYSRPEWKIFGTFDHVAPEIEGNNIVLVQSDNYSLGRAIIAFLPDLKVRMTTPKEVGGIEIERIEQLAEDLTQTDPIRRPKFLSGALLKNGIISESEMQTVDRQLLGMKLLSDFRLKRREKKKSSSHLKEILSWKNHIFGFPEELAEDLEKDYHLRPLHALKMIVPLLRAATLSRFDDNWQIYLDKDDVSGAFEEAEKVSGHGESFFPDLAADGFSSAKFVERLLGFRKHEKTLKTLLALERILQFSKEGSRPLGDDISKRIIKRLAENAQLLGYYEESIRYYSEMLENPSIDGNERVTAIFQISYNLLVMGKINQSEEWLNKGELFSEEVGDRKSTMLFRRQKAWILLSRGKDQIALDECQQLAREAEQLGLYGELGRLQICISYFYWRRGINSEAEKALLDSLANMEKAGDESDLIIPLSNLCLLYFENGEYEKAIECGEKAAGMAEEFGQISRVMGTFMSMSNTYIRLARYDKATEWINKYLSGKLPGHDARFFRNYYSSLGNLLFRRGEFESAKEKTSQALEMYESEEMDKMKAKDFHRLALIALFQGDHDLFAQYRKKAHDFYWEIGDKSSAWEIEFLDHLQNLYDSSDAIVPLLSDLDNFVSSGSRYYAVFCLFHIFLYGNETIRKEVIANQSPLLQFTETSKAPTFQAVSEIHKAILATREDSGQYLNHFKNAYRLLLDSGESHLALRVCLEIGKIYRAHSQSKLAGKFQIQSLSIAKGIGNLLLAKEIREQIEIAPSPGIASAHMLESFKQISEIIANIDDYDKSLERLVGYAINETGAERGVLLLRSDEHSDLVVKSIVNCDPNCVEDIRQFSQSICRMVSQGMNPLIIDNAKEDDRTRKYKSIIAYNILSVICLPIKIEDRLAGVIYLDHHTIPALFEHDDLDFVYSIANFISVLLSSIRNQKFQFEIRKQLVDDLANLGKTFEFITQNEIMQKMLSGLPEIARHNASVLLIGESGTGKEILAEMIHNLSYRSRGPMIKVNCAAIAGTLIESELFGVGKNVATGVDEREGKFEAADGGTLFLDEIGDMPLEIQAKVLHVLEYQRFEKVGSNRTIVTDARFIYATNKDLKSLVKEGKFREDLFYRINTILINIPPLRDRKDDIPSLLKHFLSAFTPEKAKRPIFSSSAMEALIAYPWPGNVRELRNIAERYSISHRGRHVDLIDLPIEFQANRGKNSSDKSAAENIEKARIRQLLEAHNWNRSKVARIQEMPLTTLRRKIQKYRIIRGG